MFTYQSKKVKSEFSLLQYAEKRFVQKVKDSQHLLSVAEQLWESVRMNDKKSVYRLIVVCEVDVNAILGQASINTPLTLAKAMIMQDPANAHQNFDCMDGDSVQSANPESVSHSQFINHLLDGCSLLHLACQTADISMVELLLQHGANINSCDSRGQAPLHHAIRRGRIAIARLLLTRYFLLLSEFLLCALFFPSFLCLFPVYPQFLSVLDLCFNIRRDLNFLTCSIV